MHKAIVFLFLSFCLFLPSFSNQSKYFLEISGSPGITIKCTTNCKGTWHQYLIIYHSYKSWWPRKSKRYSILICRIIVFLNSYSISVRSLMSDELSNYSVSLPSHCISALLSEITLALFSKYFGSGSYPSTFSKYCQNPKDISEFIKVSFPEMYLENYWTLSNTTR